MNSGMRTQETSLSLNNFRDVMLLPLEQFLISIGQMKHGEELESVDFLEQVESPTTGEKLLKIQYKFTKKEVCDN